MKKKIYVLLLVLVCLISFPLSIFGHSRRTDSSGGHHDYKNKSGLGFYRFRHFYSQIYNDRNDFQESK